uniref:Protein Vpu n=1 Tax=Human immunodeficiency virus type 1 TaxID=11676 RepID=Q6Y906_HV1|nr:vpu protein [Human immunodeficiency virus 1]
MYKDQIILIIIFCVVFLIAACIWLFILKTYLEQKKQDRREKELLRRLQRIIEIRDDSDYESNGEEEQEVMDLVHEHGFVNPMFEL